MHKPVFSAAQKGEELASEHSSGFCQHQMLASHAGLLCQGVLAPGFLWKHLRSCVQLTLTFLGGSVSIFSTPRGSWL